MKRLLALFLILVVIASLLPVQAIYGTASGSDSDATEAPTTATEETTIGPSTTKMEETTEDSGTTETEETIEDSGTTATEETTEAHTSTATEEPAEEETEEEEGTAEATAPSVPDTSTKYSVTFDAGKGTLTDSGASSMTRTYKSGTQIGTLPKVTAPKNKKFKGWYYNNTKLGGSGAASSQTVTGDMTITAMYVDLEYQLVIKITKNNNYDTAIHFATDNVTAGQNLLKLLNDTYAQSVMDVTPKGYKMEKSGDVPKWRYYDTGMEILESDETTNTTQNVYVNCTARTYTISFDSQGGSKCDDITVTYDSQIGDLPTPTRAGYEFQGWFLTDIRYQADTIFRQTASIELAAGWKEVTYKITYSSNGGAGAPSAQIKKKDYAVQLSRITPSQSGCEFLGWATMDSFPTALYFPGDEYIANEDLSLYAVWQTISYTIQYRSNGGSNSPLPQTKLSGEALTLRVDTPVRTGYAFLGWATAPDSNTVVYQPGDYYMKDSPAVLYAVWKPNTYTVKFNAGGGTGTMSSRTGLKYDSDYTLTANAFKYTGKSFAGWNTKSDGSGTQYADKASVKNLTGTNGKTVTLYARWKTATYAVTFDANGGSGAPDAQKKTYNKTLTLSSAKPTRKGYTFQSWNTKADGSGTAYKPGASYTKNAKVTLYAQWKVNTYTIKFSANGGTGTMSSLTGRKYGKTYTLTANAFKRTGYSFTGWNTKADGSGTAYADKASVKSLSSKNGATVTMYAQWKKLTYKVTYDANGGTGAPDAQKKTYNKDLTLSSVKPTREGYSFQGWATSASSATVAYKAGATYTKNAKVTLYAVWKKK